MGGMRSNHYAMVKFGKTKEGSNMHILKVPRVGAFYASVGRLFHSFITRCEQHSGMIV